MKIQLSDHFTYKKLLRFTLPSIAMMIFTSIYGVVDGLFISNVVGESAFASINLIWPYTMIFGAIGSVFGVGGSALVAFFKGRQDEEKANQVFTMLVFSVFALGIILIALSEIFLPKAVVLLGATESLMDNCIIYGRILSSTIAASLMQYVFQTFLITAERPRLALVFTISAGVTNMILDWLFIAVFRWGVAGAAAATCIGECVGGLGPFIYFIFAKNCPLKIVRTRFMPREFFKAASNGVADGITNLGMSLVNIIFNLEAMRYIGEYGVSAYGVIMYVNFIFVGVYFGYSIGVAPVISYHYGSGNTSELRNLFRKSIAIVALFTLIMTSLALVTARPVASIFAGYDEEFLALTTLALRLYSISYFFCGFNMFGSNLFAALNNGLVAGILSLIRIFVFQLLMVILLPLILGSTGLWLAMAFAEAGVLIVTIIIVLANRRKYQYL